ncbi:MAG: UDP-N-acetylmuramate:L-alanyl-gamma-D-glutamyl-meso-diaminopimelate ligase, partial [Nitrosopumilaceae archaeon]|nr:UDP-N-acetylmuramate:L-alanyl-gamma-D-glutamyl-meso-diaminopimelate ligase [Nitrosopumilaceae archaeon]NIU88499.1 UDP-N-acetylmuramate:L-alanyl-gamma-D-glutamyl-meso-diaminopimelate ligase [Nitrosopumilaceae archaeon]NIV66742.1 UDP-N-acetylmuramate:L-alanyl-gamma-D-glutamyl-meso-diaminopimelate ligase [Nitrosopumilaceae archaeon]NIX62705.1 UDP-N-acetylmuramate:L-alanyl-gamma-D-glutamyl-meso-diaminopimelate ligase [Nitrosopumilaceae archaeon]
DWDKIKIALKTFKGVKRRLEYWGRLNGALVFDDFAHHPTAIRKTLQAIKEIYPQKRIITLFEPRTNTTVRNIFQEELIGALSMADVVVITP